MPLPGGAADKDGNRFERLWSVLMLSDLLREGGGGIRFEVPGPEGEGFEFRVERSGGVEWHQVKRQRAKGDWSVAALAGAGVFRPWWPKLRAGERCVFVSGTSATGFAELVDRASKAVSYQEFSRKFLTGKASEDFHYLRTEWGESSGKDAFEALRLVRVEIIGESQLKARVVDRLESLVEGDPKVVFPVLDLLVSESTHRYLSGENVWEHLEVLQFVPRCLSRNAEVGRKLTETVEVLRARQEPHYIGGRDLPRAQADQAFDYLIEGRRVLVAGAAGAGKSVVVLQVIDRAVERGWPVLALSADDAVASSPSPRGWGEALGLPGSPATVLAGVVGAGTGLLVIDQLDAVGSVSGRHPERRDLIAALLQQAVHHPGVRVLVACRRFDLDHDRVLRGIAADEGTATVEVGQLGEKDVTDALDAVGVSASGLSTGVVQLLRVPLHLALYVGLAGAGVDVPVVRSLTDLYACYCEEKRRECRARRGADEWWAVVAVLVSRMVEDQELTAPVPVLGEFAQQREVMCSEGVLIQEDRRVRFFHETLFDHVFVEWFVGRGQTLQGLLEGDEQGLFRRAQVRQILTYERTTDRAGYLRDLAWLLTPSHARFHLMVLGVDLLQITADPTLEEWAVLRPIAVDPCHPLHLHVWQVPYRNPAWFPVLDEAGEWGAWLAEDPIALMGDRAVWALSGVAGRYPQRAVELLRGMPPTPARVQRLRWFLLRAPVHQARELVELMVGEISSGLLDDVQAPEFWYMVGNVAGREPEWAVDLLQALLGRLLDQSMELDTLGILRPTGLWGAEGFYGGDKAIEQAVQHAPAAFVDRLLPLCVELIGRYASSDPDQLRLRQDPVRATCLYGRGSPLVTALYEGLESAVREVARTDPEHAERVLTQVRGLKVGSAFLLVAAAYVGSPRHFAMEAVDWLLADSGVLDAGRGDSEIGVVCTVIAAVSPHCPDEALDRLTNALIGYATPWERRPEGLKDRGLSEMHLLSSLDPVRIPQRGAERLAELRRKFGCEDMPGPAHEQQLASAVPPPVSEDRAMRMSDTQWLQAIRKYGDKQATGQWNAWDNTSGQARVLENLTKQDPSRFAQLLLRMSEGTSDAYVNAVLRGLAGTSIPTGLLLRAIHQARSLGGSETSRWAAWLIQDQASPTFPSEFVEIIADIAVNDPDPDDEAHWPDNRDEQDGSVMGIDVAGMNCARGAAAHAIARLLAQDPARLTMLIRPLIRATVDRILCVRAAATTALWPLLNTHEDPAVELLLTCVKDTDDHLLTSRNVQETIRRVILHGHIEKVIPVINRMVASPVEIVRRAGARLLAVATFQTPDLDPQIDEVLTGGDPAAQLGAIEVFAQNAFTATRRDRSLAVLTQAFNNPDAGIRALAAQCFHDLPGHRLDRHAQLLSDAFTASTAFPEHARELIWGLERSTHPMGTWTLDVCERYLDQEHGHMGDISTEASVHGVSLMKIVTRVYAQDHSPGTRHRCLDLMDQLLKHGVINMEKEIETIER
jgi:hypothetical protein